MMNQRLRSTVFTVFLSSLFFLLTASPALKQVNMKATGMGVTTGHIANLLVANKSKYGLHVLRQRVYIPSDGHYQSYIGEIQETTVPSGAEASIPIFGYCTEVSLLPVPVNQDLPSVDKWIPVGKIDAAQAETGIYVINKAPAPVFKKEIIPTFRVSTAFTILGLSPDTSLTISWPGTNTPVGGILDINLRPDLFASLMERVWEYSDAAVTLIQQRNEVVTPYSSNRKKEREAIIQNIIWRYAAMITGKKYDKPAFTTRILDQFKLHAAVKDIPDLERGALEEGIDQFWNIFIEAFEKAQLSSKIENKVARGLMVDITLVDSIAYPWSVIPLTDARMKPYYVPVVPIKHSSAVVPVIAGTASAGTLLVIALHNPSTENNCAFTAQLQSLPASCGLSNGSIMLTHDTISRYQYRWSTGDTIQNLIGVTAGDYSVTVTKVGTTCSQTLQSSVINNNQPITASFITEDAHCGAEDGSIVVSVDPPGFYTYLWSTGSTEQNLIEVSPGTYTLTITAAGTCTDTAEATINALPPDFTVDLSSTPADCGAANGTASAVVSPEGNYTYHWSDGSITPTISALYAGSYSVTVTPAETTCSIVKDIQVNELPPVFQLTPLTTPASCGAMNGTAAVIIEPPGEYQFQWSNGQTLQQITGLPAGNYEVTVTLTGTACTKTLVVTVPVSTPSFTITPSATPASCGQSDGTANVIVDPPGEYEYQWSNGDTTSSIQNLSAGTFTVTVSLPDSSCAQSIDVVVDQLPPAFTLDISSTPASCGVMDGSASVTINPPGAYDFAWSNQQTTSQITGLAAGDYTITVTLTGTQCSQVSHVTVDQLPPSFTVTISSTPANCGLADGSATVIADPPGEYMYAWSNGQITSQAIGLMTGNYSVTVSIAGTSCEISTSISVDQIPPSFNLSTSSSPSQCGMSNGVAAVEVFPAGEYTLQWSNGQSGSLITGLAPGDYIVMVSQAGSSCFLSDTVTVQQIPINLIASFQNTAAHCGLSDGSASITIDPQGTYTYSWDNGQTGSMLQQVPAGHYFVTVSDVSGCTATFTTSIDQLVAEYIEINSTSGGTCIGGGEITFTLSTPGPGPLRVDMMTPAGPSSIVLPPGTYNLSAYVNVLPGAYEFNVWDESVGQTCLEQTSSAVADLTPALMVNADSYSTQSDQSVSGNVLQNDSGLGIQLTGTSAVVGGIVSSSGDGSFTYTPNSGFSGTGSFVYTVTDACGNSSTGLATITVIMISCNFTITSILTTANCSLSDGAIAVQVNQPGSYQYHWNTGQTTSTITDIPAGTYTVTITDINTNCALSFNIVLNEYAPDYISNLHIFQPTCTSPAQIEFTLTAPGSQNLLTVSIEHPGGLDAFPVEEGVVELSDYVDLVEGQYHVEVYIGDAAPNCVDDFSATLNAAPSIAIEAGAVTPPTNQSSMDGSVIINVTDSGQHPYTIFVDGVFHGTSSSETINVTGLGVGFYDIYIEDAAGCVSNTVSVIIPIPPIVFSFEAGLLNLPTMATNEYPGMVAAPVIWKEGFISTVYYHIRGLRQSMAFSFAPPARIGHLNQSGWSELSHLTTICSRQYPQFHFSTDGGMGIRFIDNARFENLLFLTLRVSSDLKIGKAIQLRGQMALNGWTTLERPQWRLTISFPFIK